MEWIMVLFDKLTNKVTEFRFIRTVSNYQL
jgi:hypothetical protein